MNEEPKSVWTRPWQGRRKFLGWFAILAAATFVVFLSLGLMSAKDNKLSDLAWTALILSVGISALSMALVWFISWLCSWRNFRRFLFGFACCVTLVALFYAEENWRGKHAWGKYKRAGEAKGEKFDLTSVAPPPVPDDQNFAMQPIWVEEISGMMGMEKARTWYGDRVVALGHTNPVRSLAMPLDLNSGVYGKSLQFTNREGNWQIGEKIDLKARQDYYRVIAGVTNSYPVPPAPQTPAEDVLLALSKYDSAIEKLRTARKLPYARFPVAYADDNPAMILLPHLASLKGCAVTLRLRAVAELQSGQTEKALEDVKLLLRLTESLRSEPFFISHLVHIAMLNLALQPVWEGLAEHKWSDAQLVTLEAELGKLDFLADYSFSVRGERAAGVGLIDYLRRNRNQIAQLVDQTGWSFDDDDKGSRSDNKDFPTTLLYLAPGGWFEQNKRSNCRMHDEYFLPVINLETRVFSTSNAARANEVVGKLLTTRNPYGCLTRLLLPVMQMTSKKFVQAQSSADLARIAIALERYRLVHNQYPETLAGLAPQFMTKLPHDVINGQPLKCRRTDDGRFVLYSVGWNEKDDGGTTVPNKSGNGVNWNEGDWVWRYPAK